MCVYLVDVYPCMFQLRVDKWWGNRKELATVRTICSHVQNMIKGVTLVSKRRFTHKLIKYLKMHDVSRLLCDNLILFCRVSDTKCDLCMPISPLTW